MSEATKPIAEPWHICANGDCQCGQILGPNSEYICTVKDPVIQARIVACVNACAGFPDSFLKPNTLQLMRVETEQVMQRANHFQQLAEHRGRSIDNLMNISGKQNTEIERLTAQRDQMLATMEAILDAYCPLTGNPTHDELVEFWRDEKAEGRGDADIQLDALAAIAAAKGGAA